jgi:hypothetical protein
MSQAEGGGAGAPGEAPKGRPRVEAFLRAYSSVAVIGFNTLLTFVAVNLVAFAVLKLWKEPPPREARRSGQKMAWDPAAKYGMDAMRKAYSGMSDEAIHKLLRETWSRPLEFDPFTQFREAPFKGHFVNVHPAGFRVSKNQGPWPMEQGPYNVFLIGGSTAFSYGLPDGQTFASALADELASLGDVRVYNFGCAFFFSTQERILFEDLLASGAVPTAAVFLDGLNDFLFVNGTPQRTNELLQLWAKAGEPAPPAGSQAMPILELLRRWTSPGGKGVAPAFPDPTTGWSEDQKIEAVIHRYFENKRLEEAAAASHGVKVAFAWQPVPTYKYDLRLHPFQDESFRAHALSRPGYERMADFAAAHALGDDFVWCADLQESAQESLYLDQVHYTAKTTRLVANCVARAILDRGLF